MDLKNVVLAGLMSAAMGLNGCGDSDCSAKDEPLDRDWCHQDAAAKEAQAGRLDPALTHVRAIQDPSVRAVAIDRTVMAAPSGLDQATVTSLCNELPEPHAAGCTRTWNRPHLWTK